MNKYFKKILQNSRTNLVTILIKLRKYYKQFVERLEKI